MDLVTSWIAASTSPRFRSSTETLSRGVRSTRQRPDPVDRARAPRARSGGQVGRHPPPSAGRAPSRRYTRPHVSSCRRCGSFKSSVRGRVPTEDSHGQHAAQHAGGAVSRAMRRPWSGADRTAADRMGVPQLMHEIDDDVVGMGADLIFGLAAYRRLLPAAEHADAVVVADPRGILPSTGSRSRGRSARRYAGCGCVSTPRSTRVISALDHCALGVDRRLEVHRRLPN